VKSLEKYLEPLRQMSEVAIADWQGEITVHDQQESTAVVEATSPLASTSEPVQSVPVVETQEPEFQVQSLFDTNQFSAAPPNRPQVQPQEPAQTPETAVPEAPPSQSQGKPAAVEALRDWYRAARDLGLRPTAPGKN
jgi:hypothetical protein